MQLAKCDSDDGHMESTKVGRVIAEQQSNKVAKTKF